MKACNLPELGIKVTNQINQLCRDILYELAGASNMLRKLKDYLSKQDLLSDEIADCLEKCRGNIQKIGNVVSKKI